MNSPRECTLSIDAMGGDHAPGIVIDGLDIAAIRHPNLRYQLHGEAGALEALLGKKPKLAAKSKIVPASDAVAMDDKPSQALRRGRGTSMWRAIAAVKAGEADAAVSAGNTGALMAMAKVQLRTMTGIERPAIAGIWPSMRGEVVVLDCGANVGLDEKQLVDFAILGEAYARVMLGLERPTVGLLNIGAEEVKGTEAVKAAANDLRSSGIDMDFYGFVEGNDIALGTVDVVVTDGFTGNIALKTAEGVAQLIAHYLRTAMRRTILTRIGAIFASGAFRTLREKLDPRTMNGGVFLGLNGVVVKSHGGTDAKGFAAAIDVAADLAKSDLADKVHKRLVELRGHVPPTHLEKMDQPEDGAVQAAGE